MTGQTLAILSTAAWCVGTGFLFVLLANWSAGNGSWSIVSGVARGVQEWAAGTATAPGFDSPSSHSSPAAMETPTEAATVEELWNRSIGA